MIGTRILVFAAGLWMAAATGAAQDATREEMNHDFIFNLSGISKQEIYERTMKWIINNIRSPGAVIQSEDLETGTIIANGVTTMTAESDSVATGLSFRLSVDVREGKERVRFLNLQISRGPEEGWSEFPGEGIWHRGAQKRFVLIARTMSDYVKMKTEP